MGELRFDGRVALVTGAGGSIGRAHAMLLASRGAKLVINDYNTTISGDRSADTDNPGTRVVKEIRDMGGEAVFNGDSVADPAGASRMVQDAIDNFGRIDIIVNNAGIVVSDHVHEEPGPLYSRNFDILLNGPLLIVRAAWEIMKAQGYGRKIGREHA